MFEAGAISKSPGQPRLCTILFGIERTDVQGPLERFQGTKFSKEEIHQLKTINSNANEEEALSETTLNKVFEMWWPKLEEDVSKIMKEAGSSTTEVRDQRDLLQEVLGLTRVMAEQQNQIREMVGELSNTDKAGAVFGAMIRAYNEPPTGELANAERFLPQWRGLKSPLRLTKFILLK
jgi:hypothetical protein